MGLFSELYNSSLFSFPACFLTTFSVRIL
uniref:Uncharacterized protein n=1 Tax=Anguilla anguilla TaxID=7936 RepID=A0A0E9QUU8_ANGAN